MTHEQWEQLQDEYGFKTIDIHYDSMSVEKGRQLLQVLSDNFDDIYNDEEE